MSLPIIEVRNLSKRYRLGELGAGTFREELSRTWHRLRSGKLAEIQPTQKEFWALRDVSFDVKPGEVKGIIGRNGAGKSTLLKILSRITEPTEGEVILRGRITSLLEVGTGFNQELTGRENIFLNGTILGMKKREIAGRLDEIVAFAEVETFLDTPVKRYSSGMYVRLAFAVAAHLEPEILIVDEVLAVGDAQFQKKCLGKMQDVADHGRTVLFVSHNMAMMAAFCETAVWLDRGKVVESGKANEVINRYLQSSTSQSANIVELGELPRDSGSGTKLRLTRLEWLTGLPLFHTQSAKIRIDFEAHTDIDSATIGIGFSTLGGQRLLTYETDDPGAPVNLKKGCHYSATLELESLPLPPAYYSVDLGSRSGPMQGIDYLPGCLQVEVAPGKKTQGHQARGDAGVRLPSTWHWSAGKTSN